MTNTTPPDSPEWRAFSRDLRRREAYADYESMLGRQVDLEHLVQHAEAARASLDEHLHDAVEILDGLCREMQRIEIEVGGPAAIARLARQAGTT